MVLGREWIRTAPASNSLESEAPASLSREADSLVVHRISGAVEVARRFDTGVDLEDLIDLLPEHGPATVPDLTGWIQAHPETGRVFGNRALGPRSPALVDDEARRERAEEYYLAATRLLDSAFRASRPLIRVLAVTGSTAYGAPRADDDCDLMAVVRPGSAWVFLAHAFFSLRIRRWTRPPSRDPEWCLNYVMDEDSMIREYSAPRGFLFAREALTAHPVQGEAYYRGLLGRSEWIRKEAPRLYARWEATPAPMPQPREPAPWAFRILNAIMYPVIASYLQFKGLRANHRLRRAGRDLESFRTITRLGQMSLATRKFEQLADRMAPASQVVPESASKSDGFVGAAADPTPRRG